MIEYILAAAQQQSTNLSLAPGCTEFLRSGFSATSAAACILTLTSATYIDLLSGEEPAIGDTVYTDSGCSTTPLVGQGLWYRVREAVSPTTWAIQVNDSGLILDVVTC